MFVAHRHRLHDGVEGDGGLSFEGLGLGALALGDTDGVDDDEAGLGLGVGDDALEVVLADDAQSAALPTRSSQASGVSNANRSLPLSPTSYVSVPVRRLYTSFV